MRYLSRAEQDRHLLGLYLCWHAAGSGRSFRAYVFQRLDPPGCGAPRREDLSAAALAALVDPVVNREAARISSDAVSREPSHVQHIAIC